VSQDLIAELTGYRNELAAARRRNNTDRAAAVTEQIERVTGQVRTRIEQLLAQAGNHEEAGQDVLAAQARVEAKRLGRETADATPAGPGAENTAQSAPRETAVTKGRTAKREDS
jgi:hypothetical protein